MIADKLIQTVDGDVEVEDVTIVNADDEDEGKDVAEYKITSFGIDYDVDGIVRRLEQGTIDLPEFQRTYVWPIRRASKFIESLLMNLPVPGIFLYREHASHKQLVIDGQQRLESLRRFYEGVFDNKEFALIGVRKQFEGLTYQDLTDEQKTNLDDSIIHATIIKQDEPDDGGSGQFEIFQRLNANATPLSAQEIRAASFSGEFCQLLETLNNSEDWRKLFGQKHRRRRDEELILRFFALYYNAQNYKRPMKGFINDFMSSNRHLKKYSSAELTSVFEDTISNVLRLIGPRAFKPRRGLNASLFDALMIGLARRLKEGPIASDVKDEFEDLLKSEQFETAIEYRTSDADRVETRIRLATESFADVE